MTHDELVRKWKEELHIDTLRAEKVVRALEMQRERAQLHENSAINAHIAGVPFGPEDCPLITPEDLT